MWKINYWMRCSKGLGVCLSGIIWMMAPADVSFGASVEVIEKASDGSLAFSEGTVLIPLILAVQYKPGSIADGRNHVAMGFGGNMYHPGEPFGPLLGFVQFPVFSPIPRPFFSLRGNPSWIGASPLKPLADVSGVTSGGGTIGGSFGNIGQFTLRGTIPLTPSGEFTLRGFVGSAQVATTPLPAGVWLFLSGMSLIGVVQRYRTASS
jgi:hypothetical protein